jgi:hypothetical protein
MAPPVVFDKVADLVPCREDAIGAIIAPACANGGSAPWRLWVDAVEKVVVFVGDCLGLG